MPACLLFSVTVISRWGQSPVCGGDTWRVSPTHQLCSGPRRLNSTKGSLKEIQQPRNVWKWWNSGPMLKLTTAKGNLTKKHPVPCNKTQHHGQVKADAPWKWGHLRGVTKTKNIPEISYSWSGEGKEKTTKAAFPFVWKLYEYIWSEYTVSTLQLVEGFWSLGWKCLLKLKV